MSYVIYHKETTKIVVKKSAYDYAYATMAAAKAAMTRKAKQDCWFDASLHAIMETKEFFATVEKKEIRKGIAGSTGRDFEVGVNTPWTSGPWSETYWSS